MSRKPPLTPNMQKALDLMRENGGALFRHYGGFWYPYHPADKPGTGDKKDYTFGPTVHGLQARGFCGIKPDHRKDRGFTVLRADLSPGEPLVSVLASPVFTSRRGPSPTLGEKVIFRLDCRRGGYEVQLTPEEAKEVANGLIGVACQIRDTPTPDGYRFLKPGERVVKGDEFCSPLSGEWRGTLSVGKYVSLGESISYRRKV